MKVAVVDKKDIVLKVERSCIKFDGDTLPFGLMDILVINHRVTLKSSDILKLNREGIVLLIISHNNINISMLNSANAKRGELRLAQYNALNFRLELAKYFISQKIKTHAEHLTHFGIDIAIEDILGEINQANSINSLMGLEGKFAKIYFKEFFGLFPLEIAPKSRVKNPPKDPVNALLSFWYSLYYNIITVKLLSMGFDPIIGYLHTPFRTHNALASDLIEIFRAEINHAVLGIFQNKLIGKEDFSYKNGSVYLKFEGRKRVWSEFVALSNVLNPKLKREIARLRATIEGNNKNEKV